MPRYLVLLSLILCLFPCTRVLAQNAPKAIPSVAEKTEGLDARSGYFDFWYSEKEGKVYLAIDRFDEEFLYVNSLAAGVGSNDLGLDRGQLGETRVVRFRKTGNKLLLEQPNQDYRASSDNAAERASVAEAFATSVSAALPLLATDRGAQADAPSDDRYLIDGQTPLGIPQMPGEEQQMVGWLSDKRKTSVVQAWVESEGHCQNLMNPRVVEFAASCQDSDGENSSRYWTQVLAEPNR